MELFAWSRRLVADSDGRAMGRQDQNSAESTNYLGRKHLLLMEQTSTFSLAQVNTPFIVAPPSAAKDFYSSIAGSRQLPHPYGQFHAYPCFNPPKVHFEFLAQRFEVLKGKHDEGTFSPGGRFSLGRMNSGSGYCIGIVVESRMGDGMSLSGTEERTSTHSSVGGNGLSDVWIVGEPFFRDVEVVFNVSFGRFVIKI